jgi:hypothetical protein
MMGSEESAMSKAARRLHHDLSHLSNALTETSWGEILFYYLDLMDRFYSSENSVNSQSLPGFPLEFLDDSNKDYRGQVCEEPNNPSSNELLTADNYHKYLGNISGPIYRGFVKLAKMDTWLLSADELMAIIRSLTDDILSFHPVLAEDLTKRYGIYLLIALSF